MDTAIEELDTNMNELNKTIDDIDISMDKIDKTIEELNIDLKEIDSRSQELNKSIEELETMNQEINKTLYTTGDYIRYYKLYNKNKLIKTNGIIYKSIRDNLFVVINSDTNLYEKIKINDIIGKLDDIDMTYEYATEIIDYTADNIDIIFLSIFFISELLLIFVMYLYFQDISLMSFIPTSINTIIQNTTEKITDYINVYFYESNMISVEN